MRTPKRNSLYIKKYFKLSTIPRLKEDLKYNSLKDIDNCPIISKWLDICFEDKLNRHVQDDLFSYITENKAQ